MGDKIQMIYRESLEQMAETIKKLGYIDAMWIDLVRTCQSVLSMEVWILTLKGKKVDPDQASLERKKIRTDEHNNIWFAQSKFTQLLDVFCIFFDEQNNMFPPVQVDPAQPSQLPLRGASRKVPESPGGAQRVHPPAQESWKNTNL